MSKTFGYSDEHRPFLVFALLIAIAYALVGCGGSTQKLIVSANEAQDAAAKTYDAAKVTEMEATAKCRAALTAANRPLPTAPEQIKPLCASVGAPVPYDPVKLKQAAGPINALYDGIRAVNAARTAGTIDPSTAFVQLASLFEQVVADLTQAGVLLPKTVLDISATLKGAP